MSYKYGWVIKGGQKYFTTHHEKSARDKNSEVEGAETFEVGESKSTEKGPSDPYWRQSWFGFDAAREIPPAAFISGQDRL